MKLHQKINLQEDDIECYGKYKAKIPFSVYKKKQKNKKDGKLVLVTAINPTPLGEGKTTISIGLADALSKIGKKNNCYFKRTITRSCFWNKRWGNRRRICTSSTYGRYKFTF